MELRLEDAKGTKPRQQLSHVSTVLSQSSGIVVLVYYYDYCDESKQTLKCLLCVSGIPKPQHKFADRLDNVRIEGTKRKTIAEEEHEAQLRNLTYRDWQVCTRLHIPHYDRGDGKKIKN